MDVDLSNSSQVHHLFYQVRQPASLGFWLRPVSYLEHCEWRKTQIFATEICQISTQTNHNSTYSRVTVENRQHNRPKFAIFSITQPDTSRNTLNTIQSTSSHENMFKNWPDFCCLGVGLADDLTGVFVAVVDLPVDFSAGFLPLSGCFLSSALALVLSAASPAWEYEKSNSEEHCYLKPFQNVLTAI